MLTPNHNECNSILTSGTSVRRNLSLVQKLNSSNVSIIYISRYSLCKLPCILIARALGLAIFDLTFLQAEK